MMILGLVLALVVDLSMGLLGAGGSILAVPIFVYVIGFEVKASIAMSLAVVGATSLVGAIQHWRIRNVNLRIALMFAPAAMAGTYLGARLAVFFSGGAQMVLFGTVLLAAGLSMLRETGRARDAGGWHLTLTVGTAVLIILEALAVGVLTGLVGVGGGFLIVPVLVLLGGLPMKQAIGTSLVIITLKSFAGFVGYLGQVDVAWGLTAGFTGIAVFGILVGTQVAQFVSARSLKRGFALLILVMGVVILYENLFSTATRP